MHVNRKQISSKDLLDIIRQTRLREYQEIEPELRLFRASPEEIQTRAAEEVTEAEEIERMRGMDEQMSELSQWASGLARAGREGVRFQRWQIEERVKRQREMVGQSSKIS
jgi:hypothetical protein